MRYEVTEVCPHCESENTIVWNVDIEGYVAYCPRCGNKMMLCDECLHAEDNKAQKCDWCENGCWRVKMNFNWDGLTQNDFINYCACIENEIILDGYYVGCVRVGDLCFDLIAREYNDELVLDYDLYAGGFDDGYGYGKDNYPYTEVGGGSFQDSLIYMSYNDFVKQAEEAFSDYIYHSNYSVKYNLADKANEPLHIW